jgi:hypothetical protein
MHNRTVPVYCTKILAKQFVQKMMAGRCESVCFASFACMMHCPDGVVPLLISALLVSLFKLGAVSLPPLHAWGT